jgi:crotonobetainyl-CoA:carnitine CoA-transferase CaiB-like acyl-CoA transferase
LDLTDEKGFLCGKVLGDLGADVIKIERPGGDPARMIGPFYKDIPDPAKSLYWFAFNMNKRSITLDIQTADGRDVFKRLVKSADFVIESFDPGHMDGLGLGYEALSQLDPRIIMTSITPFGQTGPYAHYKASDIALMAMSGFMYIVGEPDRPPVRISFPQAYLHGGVEAALGSMTAHHYRQKSGEGQHVDVSIRDAVILTTDNIQMYWDMNKVIVRRGGGGFIRPESGALQVTQRKCKDGYICFIVMGGPLGADVTEAMCQWMDEEGMLADSFKGIKWAELGWDMASTEIYDRMSEAIDDFLLKHTKMEILEEGVKRRIMIYPTNTSKDIYENPQLKAREFWVGVEHPELGETLTYPGAFVKASETPWKVWRRAPLIGEHNEEIYMGELGLSKEELIRLKEASVI